MLNSRDLHPNEIRDYIARAPKRWSFDGRRMVNNSHVRLKWLADLARGTLDERINRRAGITNMWRPWHNPVFNSVQRHKRKLRRRQQ